MKTSTSLFAKALATENIFVSFDASAQTAAFDVEARTLIIPDWKVSDSLRDMIVAHEVAHALYTPANAFLQSMEAARERKLNPQGYKACLNVIEDARIERMIKEKFPGCRRDFYAGYKEIFDTDLFGLKGIPDSALTIVDKINLHFKFGLFGLKSVPLSAAEEAIISRVSNCKTYEEVVEIANDLYDMAADEEEQKQKQGQSSNGMFGKTGDLMEAMEKVEKDGNPEKVLQGTGKQQYKDFPHVSCPLPSANSDIGIIPFSVMLQEMEHMIKELPKTLGSDQYREETNRMLALCDSNLDAFFKDAIPSVKELVAQFERRKAAEEIHNERMKPTGNINPDRLHQFKTHDDIFLRNLVRYDGKKHAMVFLIDWSGSMSECLEGVVRQTLLLTWFCRKAKIPYEVFLYTEHTGLLSDRTVDLNKRYEALYSSPKMKRSADHFDPSDVSLRQILSSEMTDVQHKMGERMLWRYMSRYDATIRGAGLSWCLDNVNAPIMSLHGTPTCEALMVMHDYLPKFKAKTGAQVIDFIMMTDGEPAGLTRVGNFAYAPIKSVRVQHLPTGRTLTVNSDAYGRQANLQLEIQYFLVDEIRKMGVVTVGFSIGMMSGLGTYFISRFINRNISMKTENDSIIKSYGDFYKRENFIPASPDLTPGFDEYYIVRPVKPTLTEQDDDDAKPAKGSPTLTRIRNQFIKSMVNRKVSKVFLSRFIDLIAGRKVRKFKLG